ncbi:unnamed protein product, partial [Didymodactylos carnosus]
SGPPVSHRNYIGQGSKNRSRSQGRYSQRTGQQPLVAKSNNQQQERYIRKPCSSEPYP